MAALLTQLPARNPDSGLLNVVVGTPKGRRNKYKYDEAQGLWRLSKAELQEFLRRNTAQEKDGWSVTINRGPSQGYDGKKLHHADVYLSTPLPSLEPADPVVNDSGPERRYGVDVSTERPAEG